MLSLISAIIGGFISRWHGGGYFKAAKVIKNSVWSFPFSLATFYLFYDEYGLDSQTIGATIVCFALCLLKAMGHGRFFRLHEPMKPLSEPEVIEAIIPDMPLYWYKVTGMTLVGLCAVSGSILTLGYIDPLWGFIVAVGGAFKGVNAMIFDKYTEYREFCDGFMAYLMLGMVVFG